MFQAVIGDCFYWSSIIIQSIKILLNLAKPNISILQGLNSAKPCNLSKNHIYNWKTSRLTH